MVKKQKNTRSSINEVTTVDSSCCRICQTISREALVSACNCRGSLRYVHINCLQEWVNATNRTSCELCCYQFKVIQARRYKCCQSLCIWLFLPAVRARLQSIFIFVAFLTIITCAITYFCFSFLKSEKNHGGTWSEVVVGLILVFVLLWYFKEVFSIVKSNVQQWSLWWNSCVMTKIVLEKRTPVTTKRSVKADEASAYSSPSENYSQSNVTKLKAISKPDSSDLHSSFSEYEISANTHQATSNLHSSNTFTNNDIIVIDVERELDVNNSRNSNSSQDEVRKSSELQPKSACILDKSKEYETPSCDTEQETMLCCVVLDGMEITN